MADQNLKITITALDKTKKGFASAGRGIKRLGRAVFNLKTAIVGVAGVGGFGLLIRSSINATDQLAKTASKIGTTTDALSALRYAAERTGVSTQTMDMALQRFVRRTAEAAVGTGEAKGALKELGIDARALVQLPLDKRMLVLSDAFGKVENSSDKLRLAFKLFDSEGAALVNTLGLGREGLQDLLTDAETLGLVMTQDAAAGVEKAKDSITRLKGLMDGFINQTVAAFAPAIEMITDKFVELGLAAADGDVTGIGEVIAKSLTNNLILIIRSLELFMNNFSKVAHEISSIYEVLFPSEERQALKDQIKEVSQELYRLGVSKNASDQLMTRMSPKNRGLVLQYRDLKKELEELDNTQARTFDFSELVYNLDDFRKNIGVTKEEVVDLGNSIIQVPTFLENMADAFGKVQDQMPSIQESMVNFATTVQNSLTQAFTDAMTGAKNFGDAMKGLAKSVVDSLIKMLVQYYITKPLFDAITGAFGGGAGASTATPSGKAIGGSVQAGQPYMVGERGAELFVPSQSGSIVANKNLGGGGTVINQTINVSTGVQQTVRAEIATLMPQIANATKAAVADARMRGGSYSKALVGA